MKIPVAATGSLRRNAGLFALVATSAIGIALIYLVSERTVHTADVQNSYDRTLQTADAFRSSMRGGVKTIMSSLETDDNLYFSIPLLPMIWAFGESRLVFVLSIVLFYHLLFVLVLGVIARTLIPIDSWAVYWSTVALALLIPATWLPTLLGFPDIGGATLVALALLVRLQFEKQQRVWPSLLVGFLLGGAILFRSHYVYAATAFLVAMVIESVWHFLLGIRREKRRAVYGVSLGLLRNGVASVVTVLTCAVLGFPFLLNPDFRFTFPAIYAGYEEPALHNLAYYGSIFGWLLCLLSIFGFMSGVLWRVVASGKVLFVVLFGVITFAQWVFLVGQTYLQFTLHFTIFVILGLSFLAWTVHEKTRGRVRLLVLGSGGACLAASMVLSLIPVTSAAELPGRSFFVARHAPLVREDYGELMRLMNYVRSLVSSEDKIFVAASTQVLNSRTLKAAEHKVYGRNGERTWTWQTPDTDSGGWYPLAALVKSQYVLVATPFQRPWPVESQKVVRVAHDIFVRNHEMARDFTRLPEQFVLAGTTVSIYRRLRATELPVSLRALGYMQREVEKRPGNQLDWMSLGPGYTSFSPVGANSYRLKTLQEPGKSSATVRFLHIWALPEAISLTGRVVVASGESAPAVTLRCSCTDQEGTVKDIAEVAYTPNVTKGFSLTLLKCKDAYLLFEIVRRPRTDGKSYMLHLMPVEVRPVPTESRA